MPKLTLRQLDGWLRELSEEWRGRVLLVNLWATWCLPCRKEIPEFIELQERHGAAGLQVLGIALDEEERVRQYLADHAVNYPILLAGDQSYRLTEELDNPEFLLPFSVIVNRSGRIVFRKTGRLHSAEAESVLLSLL